MHDQETAFATLAKAACSSAPVAGHTHNFYRYPARFSPQFARAAIEVFSRPGDVVVDPFMGGGTSAVEALAAGRRFLGCDINPLSLFVTRAKTTPLSKADSDVIAGWVETLKDCVSQKTTNEDPSWVEYQRNLPPQQRQVFNAALDSLTAFNSIRQRRFARCTLLRTGQWALDCRQVVPGVDEYLNIHRENVAEMLASARAFGRVCGTAFACPPSAVRRHRKLLARTCGGLDCDGRLPSDWPSPRLVLTSPPYVGIHVLYHRWQIQGRSETPAPYWLADCRDGHGTAYYTFGDRRRKDIETYMGHLHKSFRSIAALLDENSVVVQLVAFSKPDVQLPHYLKVLEEVGLQEMNVCGLAGSPERVWRIVPSRKWYARVKDDLPQRQEVLLVHRPRRRGPAPGDSPCPSTPTTIS